MNYKYNIYNNKFKEYKNINNLSYYLAGLLESNGYLSITNKNKLIICIKFNIKDELVAKKYLGLLSKDKDKDKYKYSDYIIKNSKKYLELRFTNKNTIINIINLVNGKFRTPKMYELYKAIDYIYLNYNINIKKQDIDNSNLLNNSWLSGFLDCGGNFYIRYSNKSIICKLTLEQRMIYPTTNLSYKYILNNICTTLNIKLNMKYKPVLVHSNLINLINKGCPNLNKSYYIIRVENQTSINILINYLNNYPLISSKYLDYLDWKEAYNSIILKTHYTLEGKSKIQNLKLQMNDSRLKFNWDHLNLF